VDSVWHGFRRFIHCVTLEPGLPIIWESSLKAKSVKRMEVNLGIDRPECSLPLGCVQCKWA
jgi:hypothetical protein